MNRTIPSNILEILSKEREEITEAEDQILQNFLLKKEKEIKKDKTLNKLLKDVTSFCL